MARLAIKKSNSSEHENAAKRPSLVLVSTAIPEREAEHLEIAYGGGWDSFDSDDIDALREAGLVWSPPPNR